MPSAKALAHDPDQLAIAEDRDALDPMLFEQRSDVAERLIRMR